MKNFLPTAGVILLITGAIWFLQGINVLPGSFMTGQSKWAIIGGAASWRAWRPWRSRDGSSRRRVLSLPVIPTTLMPTHLHEMNRLEDMGRFSLVVYLGATANVLVEVGFFYWLHGRVGGWLPAGFAAAVLLVAANLLPVVLLRWREGAAGLADTPPVERMGFVRDQHRFASWVYAVASGNLFFWLMLAWAAFDVEHSGRTLLGVELLAFLCTFAPAWLRPLRGRGVDVR